MNVLMLVMADHGTTTFDKLYNAIGNNLATFDLRWMKADEQADLRRYFRDKVQVELYDRIVMFIRFKKEIKQVHFIRSIPNLVMLEYDAFQNYYPCKYRGVFSRHYSKLPWVRVISTGYDVSQKLSSEGVDCVFVPKGYDESVLYNYGLERDVGLAFLGSLRNKTYRQRREFLEELARREDMLIKTTANFKEFCELLNRIKIFVSADIGFGEYMQKIFEAMACGATVCSWNHGEVENDALGFVDMENIVLFNSMNELQSKLKILRDSPEMAQSIAEHGQQLVEKKHRFAYIGKSIVDALKKPLRVKREKSIFGFKHYYYP